MKVGSTVAAKAGADAPGGGISLCFCRRGCAAPAKRPPRSTVLAQHPHLKPPRSTTLPHHPPRSPILVASSSRSTTLRSYCKKTETNLSEDILVSIYYVRWSCVWNRLIARTGGLPPSLRSGRLRPERQVLQERQAQQVQLGRPDVQELLRLELQERQQQGLCRRPERVRVRFSRRGCRCTSGR